LDERSTVENKVIERNLIFKHLTRRHTLTISIINFVKLDRDILLSKKKNTVDTIVIP
jgi:hypothetical protein